MGRFESPSGAQARPGPRGYGKGGAAGPPSGGICPRCHAVNEAEAVFCARCGATLKSLRIVDMRPTLQAVPRDDGTRGPGEMEGMYRAKTTYRSGVLEAKFALERERGVAPPQLEELPVPKGSGTARKQDHNTLLLAAVVSLLVVLLVILVILVAGYI